MRFRLVAAALIAGTAFATGPASATEVCHSQSTTNKYVDTNGLWVAACVGDERESPVYATCGSYTMSCAR